MSQSYLKIMSDNTKGNDAPFELVVLDVNDVVKFNNRQVSVTTKDNVVRTFDCNAAAYVMNGDGLTVSSYNPRG